MEETRYGFKDFIKYRMAATPLKLWEPGEEPSHEEAVERYITTGNGLIGTPEMAVEFIQRVVDQTGGFGTALLLQVPWANHTDTLHSLELIAHKVMPHFDGLPDARQTAYERLVRDNREQSARILSGLKQAQERYDAERAANERP
ncbi:hypothetical protein ACFZC5_33740 [Nocardia gamkensis]|uniref:hypothetical protein n=1 Tax=Nocardia gamkensis TaxID=352869 RepID=UPI0036E78A55